MTEKKAHEIAEVALPVPLRQTFDYLIPASSPLVLQPGVRVKVPYGNQQKVGILVATKSESQWQSDKLKPLTEVIDGKPLFSAKMLQLLHWASAYYLHPVGDALFSAIPALLRKGEPEIRQHQSWWRVTGDEEQQKQAFCKLSRARKQKQLYQKLIKQPLKEKTILREFSRAVVIALSKQGFIESEAREVTPDFSWREELKVNDRPFASTEQALAISAINSQQGFYPFFLEGVTGSGKTEVYLQTIENQLLNQRQVLLLVPEISLTPQTVARFEQRFDMEIGLWHSGLTDNERLLVWQRAGKGELGIIIGTRSAIFLPLKWPGMIVVDEEHDSSFKQQDGFRYHARDLAVMRAKSLDIPLVLGSATPSLETLNNALMSKYRHLQLRDKVVSGSKVQHQLIDIKEQYLDAGLSGYLIERIRKHLVQQRQVLIFMNRRGYAQAVICDTCSYVEVCERCNKPYTYHKTTRQLHCHHCGSAKRQHPDCLNCGSQTVTTSGVGTEQLEEALTRHFPDHRIARIDSDTMRSKKALNQTLAAINQQEYQILVGTQILAKGHHFPNLSMVAILDVDAALFSADFRGTEQLAQLITQVAGRTGRAGSTGEMWLQTNHPDHTVLLDLLHNGYGHFARTALKERQAAQLPPFEFQILIKAEAIEINDCDRFLKEVAKMFHMEQSLKEAALKVIGPFPALMEKRQGRFRMQLLLSHLQRLPLHRVLNKYLPSISSLKLAKKVRWSIDVDPTDFY